MSQPLAGFSPDTASADLSEGVAHLVVDAALYPLDALYGAAYVFIDRCFVLIDKPAEGKFRVTLTHREGEASEDTLRGYVGEFANELLACAWRHQISVENRASIEATTMQAIAGAMGPPSLDELADFDFTEEPFDDPLGIAQSWEEKYAKKKDSGESEG